jgi:hypothetical protein
MAKKKIKMLGDRDQAAQFMWETLCAKSSYAELTGVILHIAAQYALKEGVSALDYKALQLIAETGWKRGFASALLAQEMNAIGCSQPEKN